MDINNQKTKIEYFKGEFLHPSLDIKDGLLILGFRFISKNLKEEKLFIVATNDGIRIFQDEHFELNGKNYFIETKGRLLAKIEEKWDLEELINFIDGYNSGKVSTPNLKILFEKIKELLKKYVELEKEEDYELISAWIIGTYFHPAFSAYPFLHLKAPKNSGKTQCLNFLKQVCFNAVKAKPSLAALSDTQDSLRGTYLIDQADLLKRQSQGKEGLELVEILTDSYKKEGGKRRIRMPEKRGWKTIEQEGYGPKVFASVEELPKDLADRCLTIPLIRSQRNFPEPSEESEDWKKIRGELYEVLLTNFSVIKNSYDVLKSKYRQNPDIFGRKLELWLPMETILKFCKGEAELEKIRKRFNQLYEYTEDEPDELESAVIEAIDNWFKEEGKDEILLKASDIREKIDEDLWGNKFLTEHQKDIRIGYIIKKFNISSGKKKSNKGIVYPFQKEKVEMIKRRYIKPEENTSHSSLLADNVENELENKQKESEEFKKITLHSEELTLHSEE